jgi:hypothetical protein
MESSADHIQQRQYDRIFVYEYQNRGHAIRITNDNTIRTTNDNTKLLTYRDYESPMHRRFIIPISEYRRFIIPISE